MCPSKISFSDIHCLRKRARKDMLNYANLNDVEFEYLCQDIMQRKLNTELHRFASGQDGGIDLADDVHSKNIIVQVKHYMKSSVAQLMNALKRELGKVGKLSPKEYYVCCSKELSPQKVNEIYNLFSNYMSSASNVITLNEIDDFLNAPENIEILKKHYKLWLESTGILQEIGNTNVFVDCETLLSDIEKEKNLFVKTSAFDSALKCLQDNKTLFITGNPGVGKTMTSKMLVLHYATNGYRVRFSTNTSNLDELKKSLSRNPEIKEIILVDDCFGQAYFKMKDSQNAELLSLISYVNASPNKLLILNSRITIWQEAKERKPELLKCFEGNQCRIYILNMAAIDIVEKAKIFYNHIVFNGMDDEYFAEIKRERRYFNIVKHPNYTPRVIEFICNPNRYRDVSADNYYAFVMQQLNNPKEIWKDEYERRLEKVDRLLLLTLYSLSDSAVDESKVKICFEHRLSFEPGIDTTINQYEAALSRLLESFVQIISENGTKKLAMVNPSVNDYIDGRMSASTLEKQQLINGVFSIQQKKRLLSEIDFDLFAQTALKSHEIEGYLFDSDDQKNSFVTFYICKHKICDGAYTAYIQAFLKNPCCLCLGEKKSITSIEIFKELFQNDFICEFYRIGEFLSSKSSLEKMLDDFTFDEKVEVIRLIDHFYSGDNRASFVETVSKQLRCAIEFLCEDLDADEFDPDISQAIARAQYFDGDCIDFDVQEAISYIEDDIVSSIQNEIALQLSTLPDDIKYYQNYTDNLMYSIYGAEELINSHFEYDGYDCDYDYHEDFHDRYGNAELEVDHIFNRN